MGDTAKWLLSQSIKSKWKILSTEIKATRAFDNKESYRIVYIKCNNLWVFT